jgi:hypothetical protein
MRLTYSVSLNVNNNISEAGIFLDIEKVSDTTTWHTSLIEMIEIIFDYVHSAKQQIP